MNSAFLNENNLLVIFMRMLLTCLCIHKIQFSESMINANDTDKSYNDNNEKY